MGTDVRQAILKAADWIEGHPGDFNFNATHVPSCGSPGCAIGWINHFQGMQEYSNISSESITGQRHDFDVTFYNRMASAFGSRSWANNSKDCVIALRKYADLYHPTEPSKVLPSGSSICEAIMQNPLKEVA